MESILAFCVVNSRLDLIGLEDMRLVPSSILGENTVGKTLIAMKDLNPGEQVYIPILHQKDTNGDIEKIRKAAHKRIDAVIDAARKWRSNQCKKK